MAGSLKKIRKNKMREQQGRCHYCGLPMWDDDHELNAGGGRGRRPPAELRCTAEHLQPRSEGGTDVDANIVAACCYCNQARHKRKRPRTPEAHRDHIRRRMAKGKWLAALAMSVAGAEDGKGRARSS